MTANKVTLCCFDRFLLPGTFRNRNVGLRESGPVEVPKPITFNHVEQKFHAGGHFGHGGVHPVSTYRFPGKVRTTPLNSRASTTSLLNRRQAAFLLRSFFRCRAFGYCRRLGIAALCPNNRHLGLSSGLFVICDSIADRRPIGSRQRHRAYFQVNIKFGLDFCHHLRFEIALNQFGRFMWVYNHFLPPNMSRPQRLLIMSYQNCFGLKGDKSLITQILRQFTSKGNQVSGNTQKYFVFSKVKRSTLDQMKVNMIAVVA